MDAMGNSSLFLILFTKSLDVRFAVWIEEFLAALRPRSFELGRCDIPIRPAFLRHRTQILAEIFQRGPAIEPVAIVNFIDYQTGLEHNRVRDHRVVFRIGVLSDVEVFLDLACRVGEEGPVRTNSGAKFIRLSNVVGANRDQPAIANLELEMKLKKQFMLSAVLWAVTAAAEHKNHRMLSLQFGELAPFCRVIRKLVIGEHSPWNYVRPHMQTAFLVKLTTSAGAMFGGRFGRCPQSVERLPTDAGLLQPAP